MMDTLVKFVTLMELILLIHSVLNAVVSDGMI